MLLPMIRVHNLPAMNGVDLFIYAELDVNHRASEVIMLSYPMSGIPHSLFTKAKTGNPALSTELALFTAVKAVNDLAGTSGLVPTLLVYGTVAKIPVHASTLLYHSSRMKDMAKARKEMSIFMARDGVDRALRLKEPSVSNREVGIGGEVLIFREKPVGKSVVPYIGADRKDKSVILKTGDRLLPPLINSSRIGNQYHLIATPSVMLCTFSDKI